MPMAMQAPQFLGGVAGVGGTAEAEVFALPATQLPTTTIAAWIIKRSATETDPTEAQQVAYWNKQNAVYTPAVAQSETSFTSQVFSSPDEPAQRVKVSTMNLSGYAGKALSEEIWDRMFAKTVRFFDDNRKNGTVRAEPVDRRHETDRVVEGIRRRISAPLADLPAVATTPR